jgi:hypothetical protein
MGTHPLVPSEEGSAARRCRGTEPRLVPKRFRGKNPGNDDPFDKLRASGRPIGETARRQSGAATRCGADAPERRPYHSRRV